MAQERCGYKHQMGCTDATWRIRWTDLCSGGDAAYRYRRCSDSFSAPNAVSMESRTGASNARVVVRLIDDDLVAGGRVCIPGTPARWTRPVLDSPAVVSVV